MKEVVIRPVGGLGNQLFTYAAGLQLARSHGVTLAVDDSWFATQNKRSFELDSFQSSAIQARGQWKPSLQDRIPLGVRYLEKIFKRRLQLKETFGEPNFFFTEAVSGLDVPVSLSGYFQSWKYFQGCAPVIHEELRSIIQPTDWFLTESARLRSLGDWIGIHIRRGDFLEPKIRDFHGVVGDAYYERTLRYARRLVGDLPIVLFSDDPRAEESSEFLQGCETYVINAPAMSRPIETVNLMAHSRAMITANSSLSWWGAWLGDAPDRPVLCPRPWFRAKNLDYRDLLLPNWISLGID